MAPHRRASPDTCRSPSPPRAVSSGRCPTLELAGKGLELGLQLRSRARLEAQRVSPVHSPHQEPPIRCVTRRQSARRRRPSPRGLSGFGVQHVVDERLKRPFVEVPVPVKPFGHLVATFHCHVDALGLHGTASGYCPSNVSRSATHANRPHWLVLQTPVCCPASFTPPTRFHRPTATERAANAAETAARLPVPVPGVSRTGRLRQTMGVCLVSGLPWRSEASFPTRAVNPRLPG